MKDNHAFILRQELKRHLKNQSLTASELSRKTGVSKQVISDWLAGVMPRNLMQVKSVSTFLGLPIDTLCFGETVIVNNKSKSTNWISGRFEGKIRVIVEE